MIKLGVDGSAVKSGLSGVTNTVKGWAMSASNMFGGVFKPAIAKIGSMPGTFKRVVITPILNAVPFQAQLTKMRANLRAWAVSARHELGGFGKMLMIGAVIKIANDAKEKILEVARVSKETGMSTNMVQGLMQQAERAGVKFEELTAGIARFNKTIGAAKMGDTNALKKLSDGGVITAGTSIKTMGLTKAMHNLAVAYDHAGSASERAYLLSQAFGKGYAAMTPIFEQGAVAVDKLGKGNFFTKISGSSITDLSAWWGGIKQVGEVVGATLTNVVGSSVHGIKLLSQTLGLLSKGVTPFSKDYPRAMQELAKEQEGREEEITFQKELQTAADKEGISVAEMKNKILQEQASLLEKQADLTAEIADRDKESVKDMASKARKLLGLKSPEEMFHTVTPRMRQALKIDTLEEKARIETLRGHDSNAQRLQSQADQIRKSSPWLMRKDQNPMLKTESELAKVNDQLEPVARMAKLVNDNK